MKEYLKRNLLMILVLVVLIFIAFQLSSLQKNLNELESTAKVINQGINNISTDTLNIRNGINAVCENTKPENSLFTCP
jgi:uncharacterized protein YoxC